MKNLLLLAAILTAWPAAASEISLAGARSSHYGVKPFPTPEEWVRSLKHIRDRFPGSAPWVDFTLREALPDEVLGPGK